MKRNSLSQICEYFTVGGGSGGGVLSDRLTEDGRHTVLLLEAGADDQTPIGDKITCAKQLRFWLQNRGRLEVLHRTTKEWLFCNEG